MPMTLLGELVGGVGGVRSHLLLPLSDVPLDLAEHEDAHLDGDPEVVERDEETEGGGRVGQPAVEDHGLEILGLEKPSSHLAGGEPAANGVEEDAQDQHDEESGQSEEEAGQEEREVFPSILDSEAGLHNPLLVGQRLEINILGKLRINTEFFADASVATYRPTCIIG